MYSITIVASNYCFVYHFDYESPGKHDRILTAPITGSKKGIKSVNSEY